MLAGLVGYVAASMGRVRLVGPIAEDVPPDKHISFLVDLWAHSASYFGGFVGGILLMVWIWRSRQIAENQGKTIRSIDANGRSRGF